MYLDKLKKEHVRELYYHANGDMDLVFEAIQKNSQEKEYLKWYDYLFEQPPKRVKQDIDLEKIKKYISKKLKEK